MKWNHRILAHKEPGGDIFFLIHEVYYNETGIPETYTVKGAKIGGYDMNGIKWSLKKMEECLKKPILDADNFPKEFLGDIK